MQNGVSCKLGLEDSFCRLTLAHELPSLWQTEIADGVRASFPESEILLCKIKKTDIIRPYEPQRSVPGSLSG